MPPGGDGTFVVVLLCCRVALAAGVFVTAPRAVAVLVGLGSVAVVCSMPQYRTFLLFFCVSPLCVRCRGDGTFLCCCFVCVVVCSMPRKY